MFGVLLESNPRRQGRRGMTVASVGLHVGIIVLGVWATAESAPPPPMERREQLVPEMFTQPAAPAPATPSSPVPARTETTVQVPASPTIPALPGIDVPEGLPPVEQSLGDPFARRNPVGSDSVNGRFARALAPGAVLDNVLAEKPALPLESNEPPSYPAVLRSAAIEGTVDIEFIIGPTGRVRPGSLVTLRADHARFLESVREALAEYRYLPAEVGGRPVAVRVRQRFAFQLER